MNKRYPKIRSVIVVNVSNFSCGNVCIGIEAMIAYQQVRQQHIYSPFRDAN